MVPPSPPTAPTSRQQLAVSQQFDTIVQHSTGKCHISVGKGRFCFQFCKTISMLLSGGGPNPPIPMPSRFLPGLFLFLYRSFPHIYFMCIVLLLDLQWKRHPVLTSTLE